MKKYEVHNFQNLIIENADIIYNPLSQEKEKKNQFSVIFIRDPYEYFDYLLFDYLQSKKSILFTQDILVNIKKLDNVSFLEWFRTLNFIPFYNPQIFQLDTSKRLSFAIDNLERFDYVVPYDKIDIFLDKTSLKIKIKKIKEEKNIFLLSEIKENKIVNEFIEKDIKLYKRAKKLWELTKENSFKPLREIIEQKPIYTQVHETKDFKGASGMVNEKSIRGYALNIKTQKILTLNIYKNKKLICTTTANEIRKDMVDKFNLSTGKCGFFVKFDKSTFKKGDKIDIIIVPENIRLPLVGDAIKFLENDL
ncbi:MAG: hypothetical protein U9O24_00425 [Campylobacterota bacterium]|nr:hypothetical protein [Campylobacterota bacterium]